VSVDNLGQGEGKEKNQLADKGGQGNPTAVRANCRSPKQKKTRRFLGEGGTICWTQEGKVVSSPQTKLSREKKRGRNLH